MPFGGIVDEICHFAVGFNYNGGENSQRLVCQSVKVSRFFTTDAKPVVIV